jgi:hypothetical protein
MNTKYIFAIAFSSVLMAGPIFNNSKIILHDHPLLPNARSIDFGGQKTAIDAYRDGVGVQIGTFEPDRAIDNSTMNELVFKYGENAKEIHASTTIIDIVDLKGSEEEKSKIEDLRLSLAESRIDGVACNTDPDKEGMTYLSGICQGGTYIDGVACNTDPDKEGMTYLNGICQGGTYIDGVSCTYIEDPQVVIASWLNGVCTPNKSNGVECNDGNNNSFNDIWLNNNCSGTILVSGDPCNDNNPATLADLIINGKCTGNYNSGWTINALNNFYATRDDNIMISTNSNFEVSVSGIPYETEVIQNNAPMPFIIRTFDTPRTINRFVYINAAYVSSRPNYTNVYCLNHNTNSWDLILNRYRLSSQGAATIPNMTCRAVKTEFFNPTSSHGGGKFQLIDLIGVY